jgi:osmotically-inducible protein OsmY
MPQTALRVYVTAQTMVRRRSTLMSSQRRCGMDTDTQNLQDICAEFDSSAIANRGRLRVEVLDAVVRISGRVAFAELKAAEQAAKRGAGIRQLVLEMRSVHQPVPGYERSPLRE